MAAMDGTPGPLYFGLNKIFVTFLRFQLKKAKKAKQNSSSHRNFIFSLTLSLSVTRLGDLLDFGQLFKAFGNN